MRMVYSHKQTQLENHVEAIQELSLQDTLKHPILDSVWMSPVQVVPKKGGMTVV